MLQIMKNETEDFMALAKAYAQAERALRIERWVIVTFELRKTDGPIYMHEFVGACFIPHTDTSMFPTVMEEVQNR